MVFEYLNERPKRNGQFDNRTGEPERSPVRDTLATYRVKVEGGRVLIDLSCIPAHARLLPTSGR